MGFTHLFGMISDLDVVVPRLFCLSTRPNASVAQILNSSQAAWDFCLRWNLKDLKVIEWSKL